MGTIGGDVNPTKNDETSGKPRENNTITGTTPEWDLARLCDEVVAESQGFAVWQPSTATTVGEEFSKVGFSIRHVTWNVFSAWHRFRNFAFRQSPQLAEIITWSTLLGVWHTCERGWNQLFHPVGNTRANLIINETFSHTFRRIIFGKPKKNGLVSWWSTCYLSAQAATTAVWLIGRRSELFFSGRVWRGVPRQIITTWTSGKNET